MNDSKTKPKPIGAWAEISPDGELLFCYSGRKYGKRFEQKLSRKEIDEFLDEYLKTSSASRSLNERVK